MGANGNEPAMSKKLTFEKICAMEPEIKELYDRAKNLKEKRKAYEFWHRQVIPPLTTLVGEHAKLEQLRSFDAYEVVVDKIRAVLGL